MAATADTKVLVIEPNSEIRKSLKDFFSKKGYQVEEQSDQNKVLEQIRRTPFSCIVTEMEFSGTDPLQYVKELHEARPEIPIVVLSAKANVSMAIEVMHRGAHHLVKKPILLKEVGQVVEEALSLVKKKKDFQELLPYLITQAVFEVPGTLANIEGVIDHIASETTQWKIIDPKEDTAFRAVLRCAMHNAVIHGNKGDEKKKVKVNFILREKRCEVAVTDEGKGYDPYKHINPKELANCPPEKINCGLLRIHCFMDQVSFNARGNQIRMVKLAK